jgi:hypothetical protein
VQDVETAYTTWNFVLRFMYGSTASLDPAYEEKMNRLRSATDFTGRFMGAPNRDGVPEQEWLPAADDDPDDAHCCVVCMGPVRSQYAIRWDGCCGQHWRGMNFRLWSE